MSLRAVLLVFVSVVSGGMALAAAVNGTPRDDSGRGVVDKKVCGPGTDTVTAGPEDDAAGDCESVEGD